MSIKRLSIRIQRSQLMPDVERVSGDGRFHTRWLRQPNEATHCHEGCRGWTWRDLLSFSYLWKCTEGFEIKVKMKLNPRLPMYIAEMVWVFFLLLRFYILSSKLRLKKNLLCVLLWHDIKYISNSSTKQ